MKKSLLAFVFFTSVFTLFAAPVSVQKKNSSKQEFKDYNQIIINDTDFPVKISLLNEETHFFEEFTLEPNKITILSERLYTNPSRSKKISVLNQYVYIYSMEYITPNEVVYFLKATKRNPDNYRYKNDWDSGDDEVEDVYTIENPKKKQNVPAPAPEPEVPVVEPAPAEPAPAVEPAPAEPTPAVETIPATVETIPATVETIPATVETIPATVETIPAAEESTDYTDYTDYTDLENKEIPAVPENSDDTNDQTVSENVIPQDNTESVKSVESVDEQKSEDVPSPVNTTDSEPDFYYNDPEEELLDF